MPDKKLSEKYGEKIRGLAERIVQARHELSARRVPDTVKWNELAEIYKDVFDRNRLYIDWKKFGVWTKEIAQGTGKISGVSALWLAEYLVRGLNKLMVDNKVLKLIDDKSVQIAEYAEKRIDKKTGETVGEKPVTRFMKQ